MEAHFVCRDRKMTKKCAQQGVNVRILNLEEMKKTFKDFSTANEERPAFLLHFYKPEPTRAQQPLCLMNLHRL